MQKSQESIKSAIISELKINPTNGQLAFVQKISSFIASEQQKEIFVLKGYAGTGKTTCISAVIKAVGKFRMRTVQLAPTGKASKVMTLFSNKSASTIHRKIYQRTVSKDGNVHFALSANLHTNTLFFVDEASMISTYSGVSDGSNYRNLLEDLVEYIYSGKNCKLILIGDQMQLPPVGMDESPALDITYLKNEFFGFLVDSCSLNEVVRQASESTILKNATQLRQLEYGFPQFEKNKIDFFQLEGQYLQEELDNSIGDVGSDETIVLCRSNKRANLYNESIRRRILWMEDEINTGDVLMVVKNNYFWLEEKSEAGFIANGDTILIERIGKREAYYGFEFVSARVKLVDYPKMDSIELKLIVDTLHLEGPSLSRERMREFFFEVEKDYMDEKNRKKRFEAIFKNEYFNALQVKFSYAITGHKSQGGQWANVFIDQGYFVEDMLNKEYYRWLYTAVTRATDKVYLVNFLPDFFEDGQEDE